MALPKKLRSLDDIDEALHPHYLEQTDGSYVLDLGDDDETANYRQIVDRERAQRRQATRRVQDLENQLKTFEGIDADRARAALEAEDSAEETRLRNEKDFEAIAERKYQRQMRDLQSQLDQFREQLESANTSSIEHKRKYETAVIRQALHDKLSREGLKSRNIELALPQLEGIWQLDDDEQPIAMRGDAPLYSRRDANKPMSMEEQIADFRENYPDLFESVSGAGARHQTGANGQRVIRATQDQLRDFATYERLRNQARELGVEIEVE